MLGATGLPLIVLGPGQAELDNDILVACAEEGAGEKLALGACEDKNYRTIVAAALANGHLVTAKTPMDVNLSKQLTILIHDMGMPMERIITDPTTGALGYGIEYGYSVMERLRLAGLQGDGMTQQPMIVTPGEEAWRTKEARAGEGVPATWGDWAVRAVNWETVTAAALVESGADIVVLRHPDAVSAGQADDSGAVGGVATACNVLRTAYSLVNTQYAPRTTQHGLEDNMALTGLDIYKLLPASSKDPAEKAHANCKECGFPTCLAFAMKLAAKQAELSACPYVSEDAKAKLSAAAAPPIRLITLSADGRQVKAGNETVLFRHEKTFYNPAGLFVRVADTLSADQIATLAKAVDGYKVDYVGMALRLDGLAVDAVSGDAGKFAAAVAAARRHATCR